MAVDRKVVAPVTGPSPEILGVGWRVEMSDPLEKRWSPLRVFMFMDPDALNKRSSGGKGGGLRVCRGFLYRFCLDERDRGVGGKENFLVFVCEWYRLCPLSDLTTSHFGR